MTKNLNCEISTKIELMMMGWLMMMQGVDDETF